MKKLALASTLVVLIGGCSIELHSLWRPKNFPPPTGDACLVEAQRPAPIFHLQAPAVASAGVPFTVIPWVVLSAPVQKPDVLLPETFEVRVDHAAKRVTIVGSILRYEAAPKAGCSFPAIYMVPQAATMSVKTVLPAGTYELAIASDSFTSEKPPAPHHDPYRIYPSPQATRSLRVE